MAIGLLLSKPRKILIDIDIDRVELVFGSMTITAWEHCTVCIIPNFVGLERPL